MKSISFCLYQRHWMVCKDGYSHSLPNSSQSSYLNLKVFKIDIGIIQGEICGTESRTIYDDNISQFIIFISMLVTMKYSKQNPLYVVQKPQSIFPQKKTKKNFFKKYAKRGSHHLIITINSCGHCLLILRCIGFLQHRESKSRHE